MANNGGPLKNTRHGRGTARTLLRDLGWSEQLGHLEGLLQPFGSLEFSSLSQSPEVTPYVLWEPSILSRGLAPSSSQPQARAISQPRFSHGASQLSPPSP